jgi:predicted GIY-YIG superfamily endonuclease
VSLSKGEDALQIYVYMLRCSDGSYYVGLTRAGLDTRLADHQSGRYPGYTHFRRPVELVWSADFLWLKDAIACERRIKGWRREKKEALIRGDLEALKILARTARTSHPSTGSG